MTEGRADFIVLLFYFFILIPALIEVAHFVFRLSYNSCELTNQTQEYREAAFKLHQDIDRLVFFVRMSITNYRLDMLFDDQA